LKNIVVIGAGYVGMSLAALLAQKNAVQILEIDEHKVEKINLKESTIHDKDISDLLNTEQLNLSATSSPGNAYIEDAFFIIATPTNFNEQRNFFDTSSVEAVIEEIIHYTKRGLIIIKSTVPVGFTAKINKRFNTNRVIFSPEFLREGTAVFDNMNPSRIIVGGENPDMQLFLDLLLEISNNQDVPQLSMQSSEAEAVKIFSNSFLAMRIAFFNELDSFSMPRNLNTRNIIEGVSLDERIGSFYNNPSFGYGGYCLPKDTKQLLASFDETPQELITAIIQSNKTRKIFLVDQILALKPSCIGIYRLVMKKNSKNFRESAVMDLIHELQKSEVKLLIYEPLLKDSVFNDVKVCNNLEEFKISAEVIIANRLETCLIDVEEKVFTRDIFGNN
jgi:UDPglucose 6-dehydrogenase